MSIVIRQFDNGFTMPVMAEIQCGVCPVIYGHLIEHIPAATKVDLSVLEVFARHRFQIDGWQIEPPLCPDHARVVA